jgi:hypothetical protein
MISWSRKRRFLYAGSVLVVIIGVGIAGFLLFVYKAPTCSDGTMNGSELGVDCGGGCTRLCASAFLPPSVSWTRFEEVSPGLYNVAAYVVNPNKEGHASNIPYHIMMYDARGVLIVEHKGVADIAPQRGTLVFARMIETGKRIPARALFEFTGSPDWRSAKDPLVALVIGDKKYTEEGSSSTLTVPLTNRSVYPLPHMSVYAILYDINNNAIGFSKTVLDGIAPQESVLAPFTWPINRQGKVISIEVLPVAE